MPPALTDLISDRLTPEGLLQVLGIAPRQTVKLGDTLKAVCPVCNTKAFKTLIINTKRRTVGCRYTMCEANRCGGDFVQLVAMARRITEMEAVRQIVEELDLDTSDLPVDDLSQELESKGLEALSTGDLESARRLLEEAAASHIARRGSLSPEVAAKLAHCCWELGDHQASREHYREVIEGLIESEKIADAVLMLSDLIGVDHEWAPELHLMLGRVLRETGDVDQALSHLLSATDGLRRLGESDLAWEAATGAAKLDPSSEQVQRALVSDGVAREDWPTVLEHLDGFLALCDGETDRNLAVQVLERLDEAGQLEPILRLRRAHLCRQMGQESEAEAIIDSLAASAETDEPLAEALAEHLTQLAGRPRAREANLTRLLVRLRRWEQARESLRRLIAMPAVEDAEGSESPGVDETIRDAFSALAQVHPGDLSLRRERLEWLASHGGGPEEILRLGRNLLHEAVDDGDAETARTVWQHLSRHVGDDDDGLAVAAEMIPVLWALTRDEDQREGWISLVLSAQTRGAHELGMSAGRRFIEEVEFTLEVGRAVVECAEALGHLGEVADLARQVIEAQRDEGDWEGVQRAIRLLIDVAPLEESEELWVELADALRESGDPDAAAHLHLERAEAHLLDGETPLAERHLRLARELTSDTWAHWRAERAVARRANHAGILARLIEEALSAVECSGDETNVGLGPLEALVEEARDGQLESAPFARLTSLLARRDQVEEAEALVLQPGEETLGQGIDGQHALVRLIDDLPRSAAVWTLAIERVNDDEAVGDLIQRLPTLAQTLAGQLTSPRDTCPTPLDLIERASVRWPESLACLEARVLGLRAAGRDEEADEAERQIVERRLAQSTPSEAVSILSELCDRHPSDLDMCRRLASALESVGDTELAATHWLELASALIAQGRSPEASSARSHEEAIRTALEAARRLGGETSDLLSVEFTFFERAMDEQGATERAIALAEHRAQEGDHESALEVLRQCIKTFGETIGLLRTQAATLEQAGQTRGALLMWRQVFDRHRERSEWAQCESVLQAMSLLTSDDLEPADLERAAELSVRLERPDEARAQIERLCERCLREGEWQEAVEMLRRAVEWAEDPRPVLVRLAQIEHDNGRAREAIAALRRAFDVSLRSDDVAAAEEHLETLRGWVPRDVPLRLALLDALEPHWEAGRVIEAHLELASDIDTDDPSAALRVCRRARMRWPADAGVLSAEADLHVTLGQHEEATRCLRDLAKAAKADGDHGRAIETWERVIQLGTATVHDRWALADLLRVEGKRKRALEMYRALADEFRDRNESHDLIRAFEAMLDIDPTHGGALSDLAETCAAVGDIAGATRRWLELAALHLERNRRAPAERAYRSILEHDGESIPALDGLFAIYEQQENPRRLVVVARRLLEIHAAQRWEAAESLARQMDETHPDADDFFRRWADLLWERGDRDRAVAELESRAERLHLAGRTGSALDMLQHLTIYLPERLDIAERIGEIAFEMGDVPRARRAWKEALAGHRALGDIDSEHAVLALLHGLDPDDLDVTSAYADAALNLDRRDQALELLSALLARHRQGSNPDAQRQVLEKILTIDVDRPDDHRALAEIHLSAGRGAKACEHLQRALGGYRAAERWDDAADAAKRLEEADPTDATARQLRAEALANAGRIDEAIELFTQLATASQAIHDYLMAETAWRAVTQLAPQNVIAREQLAAILAAQGQIDDAVRIWNELAEHHRDAGDSEAERDVLIALTGARPRERDAHRRLAHLCLAEGDVEGAWLSFRQLLTHAEDQGDHDTRRALEDELLGASPDPRLRIELAQMHADAGRTDDALRLYTEVAQTHRRTENPQGARATLDAILQLDPNHVPALEMYIDLLSNSPDETKTPITSARRRLADAHSHAGHPAKALTVLEALAHDLPKDRDVLIAMTRAHLALGNREEFERALARCAEIVPDSSSPAWFLAVCRGLLPGGETPSPWTRTVREHMARVLESARQVDQHPDLFLALARECEDEGDVVRAAEIYQALIAALPEEARHRLRFIDFLEQHGQHTRAVHELMHVAEIYHGRGDRKREVLTLERARELDADNCNVLRRLGEALLAQNARGRALEHLKRAAGIAQKEGEMATLAELQRLILKIDASDVVTRQGLIDVLMTEGHTDEAVDEHLVLAEQSVQRGFLDTAAQSYRAVVQLDPRHLEAWVKLVETYTQFAPEEDLLHDFLVIARLCQSEGKRGDAVSWFRRYLRVAPDDIDVRQEYIELYQELDRGLNLLGEIETMVDALTRGGRAEEAKTWVRRSERLTENLAKRGSAEEPRATEPKRRPVVRVNGKRRGGEDCASGGPSLRAAGASRRRVEAQDDRAPAKPSGQAKPAPRAQSRPKPARASGEEPLLARLEQYRSHLESNPDNPTLHRQIAELLAHLERSDEAQRHRVRAAELFHRVAAWEDCVPMCRRALEVNPDSADLRRWLREANLALSQISEVDSAIRDAEGGRRQG